jgi:hypothetical protein
MLIRCTMIANASPVCRRAVGHHTCEPICWVVDIGPGVFGNRAMARAFVPGAHGHHVGDAQVPHSSMIWLDQWQPE